MQCCYQHISICQSKPDIGFAKKQFFLRKYVKYNET